MSSTIFIHICIRLIQNMGSLPGD